MWKKVEDELPKGELVNKPVMIAHLEDKEIVYNASVFDPSTGWKDFYEVIAWCEFEPYKEEEKRETINIPYPAIIGTAKVDLKEKINIQEDESFGLYPPKEEEEEKKKSWFPLW